MMCKFMLGLVPLAAAAVGWFTVPAVPAGAVPVEQVVRVSDFEQGMDAARPSGFTPYKCNNCFKK